MKTTKTPINVYKCVDIFKDTTQIQSLVVNFTDIDRLSMWVDILQT